VILMDHTCPCVELSISRQPLGTRFLRLKKVV
jgi:hypothetical protein